MESKKEHLVPTGVNHTWLNNVKEKKFYELNVSAQIIRCILKLYELDGIARFTEIRCSLHHAKDIQKCLILGLVKRINKDCHLCAGRNGNKISCLGASQRCAARYLYQLTEYGYRAALTFQGVSKKDKKSYSIDIKVNKFWWNYFHNKVW